MKISKIINNNLIHFYDENNVDCIAMGRGLGFGKKIGDEVDEKIVEKIYRIADPVRTDQFSTLVKDIPLAHLEVANMIIDYASSSLNAKLSDNIYISLVDHIDFALERIEKGIPLENKLLYEIKHYYTSEYLVGLEALNIVKRELGVTLPEDEAGYIAIHLVEAEVDSDKQNYVEDVMAIIQAIMNIIKYHFSLELDPDTLAYERLLVHLRYFAGRVINREEATLADDRFVEKMKNNFPEEFKCTVKIRQYLENNFDYLVSDDELIYLSVHIHRVLMAQKR